MLLTAMLFATGIALVLGSYLALSRTTLKVAHRTFFANDAANLAEAGLEEALYCFNLMAGGTATATAWSGWTISGANAMRTLTPFNRDQNAIGVTKVYVKGYDGTDATPYIVSQAVVTPFDGGAPIVRTVHVTVRRNSPTVRAAVVALNGLTMSSGTTADSFISNPTASAIGPWLAYTSLLARANTSVIVLGGAITAGSGAIRGNLYLGTGVTAPAASSVTGTITTNYSATFPLPTYPTAATVSQSYNLNSSIPVTLPLVGDVAASDGRYYYFCTNTTIATLTIGTGKNVTLCGANTGMTSGLAIQAYATCEIYMDGTLTLTGGNDINNVSWAGALKIFTSTAGTCSIGNKSQLVGCLHAPNAALTLSGNNSSSMVVGYFIAKTINAAGTMDFHYDESLQPTVGVTSYDISRWLDFGSAADRATVSGLTGGYLR
jgi:hypothetical protein